jgi:hypothetical protein
MGNIAQDKKLNPTCWHGQTPEHVEGEGSEEQKKYVEQVGEGFGEGESERIDEKI